MKTDILIIGGGPAGLVSAITAKKNNPKKIVTLVREEKKTLIPCAIPYLYQRLKSIDQDVVSDGFFKKNKINLIIDKVNKINVKKKTVSLLRSKETHYKKLILATGSSSVLIPIHGIDLPGVWQIKKDYQYLKKMRRALLRAKNIVIIGGGFIGMEMADELSNSFKKNKPVLRGKNKNITIVEMLSHCLSGNFDNEFVLAAEEKLRQKGVNIYLKTRVKKIVGKNKVEYVELDNGKKIFCEAVILSAGAKPNIELAKQAGIKVEERGAISVDKYMRTSEQDIFAVGDCAQTKDFFTQKNIPIMLASVACAEARIGGMNLYKLKRKNLGTIGAFSTYLNGLTLAAVGLIEKRAQKEKINIVIGTHKTFNYHPATLPQTQSITVKLIFSKTDKILLGGEIMGPKSIGEMINIVALAIQQKVSADNFVSWQFATHPLLTPAPTSYPLIQAGIQVLEKHKN